MLAPAARPSALFVSNDTATTEIYTLSLHDALPISDLLDHLADRLGELDALGGAGPDELQPAWLDAELLEEALEQVEAAERLRSEEHTSELQSRQYLVCRLLLEKKTRSPRPTVRFTP